MFVLYSMYISICIPNYYLKISALKAHKSHGKRHVRVYFLRDSNNLSTAMSDLNLLSYYEHYTYQVQKGLPDLLE
jgi:hypothetical protein